MPSRGGRRPAETSLVWRRGFGSTLGSQMLPQDPGPTFKDLTTGFVVAVLALHAGLWVASPPPLGGSAKQEGGAAMKTRDGDLSQSVREGAASRADSTG